ncbi:para-nitrobenzyl esterase [Lepeophtheirus salmonis]|uniref:para-nitrobenzyl esterase n=1 Tax=Lepeophtheirus salmonis TaxID=72036 RepID=UPI001AE7187F|nr:para-nitrobenzyl esterase-like [Lepeophtheirus salmonis]
MVLIIVVLSYLTIVFGDYVLIRTDKGIIRGRKESSQSFVFEGVPYADPPYRFQPPKLRSAWTGVKNSTTIPPACSQIGDKHSSEDCLYLSIYTPKLGAKSNYPVWVWIHGGDFSKGSISVEGNPKKISQTGIVIVLIQYRLGPFGFGTFESEDTINIGFLDQALALKWIQRNIKRFGGNPERIILGGSGAGGYSAARLTLNGDYSGLIISSSGIAETPWVSTEKKTAIDNMKELGERLSCPTRQDLKSCLSSKSVDEILGSDLSFIPVKDSFASLERSFYKNKFRDEFALLIGDTKYDENLDINSQLKMYLSEDNFHDLEITSALYEQIIYKLFPKYSPTIQSVISYFYTNQSTIKNDYLESIMKVITDAKYKCPVDSFANIMSFKFPVYRYTFLTGTKYGGESSFIFSAKDQSLSNEDTLNTFMTSAWSHFIKYGDPTIDLSQNSLIGWPKYKEPTNYKMILNQDMLKIVSDESKKSCTFWNELIPELLQNSLESCPNALLKEDTKPRSLISYRKGMNENLNNLTDEKEEDTSNLKLPEDKNTTVVSYKLNVLNTPFKMIYKRPGNSPIFISSLNDQDHITNNEVSKSEKHYRYSKLSPTEPLRNYYSIIQNQRPLIYDPFQHQSDPKKKKQPFINNEPYKYYPNRK